MNILMASSIPTWGGGENWMLSTACGLRERGHSITVAARPESVLAQRVRKAGLVGCGMNYAGDFDPATFWRFYRLCRRERIDVLCTNMQRVLRIAGLAARLAGVRTIIPRVGSQSSLGSKMSHVLTWKHIATGIIANSEATRRALLDSAPWLPEDRVRRIYNGIDLDRYRRAALDEAARRKIRAELEIPDDAPVIGMIGELTERKNHILVLRQLPRLIERFPDLHLWIIGKGDQREVLRAEADQLAIGSHLRLTGFRKDIPELIAAMDVLAHPALMEGFGYVLVEAMATGKPVIAADTSNIPEIIAEGETGFLCSPEDGELWAERLEEILGDPEKARRMGQAGCERAERKYSFARMLDEVEAYFADPRS